MTRKSSPNHCGSSMYPARRERLRGGMEKQDWVCRDGKRIGMIDTRTTEGENTMILALHQDRDDTCVVAFPNSTRTQEINRCFYSLIEPPSPLPRASSASTSRRSSAWYLPWPLLFRKDSAQTWASRRPRPTRCIPYHVQHDADRMSKRALR